MRRSSQPPLRCPNCGSTWFREVQFGELPPSLNIEAPEFQLQRTRFYMVCLCGEPVPPFPLDSRQRLAWTHAADFVNSLICRKANLDAAVPLGSLQGIVSREQWPALEERARQLENAVSQLRE